MEGDTLAISLSLGRPEIQTEGMFGQGHKAGLGRGRGQGHVSKESPAETRGWRGRRCWGGPWSSRPCVPVEGVGEVGAGLAFLGG